MQPGSQCPGDAHFPEFWFVWDSDKFHCPADNASKEPADPAERGADDPAYQERMEVPMLVRVRKARCEQDFQVDDNIDGDDDERVHPAAKRKSEE